MLNTDRHLRRNDDAHRNVGGERGLYQAVTLSNSNRSRPQHHQSDSGIARTD